MAWVPKSRFEHDLVNMEPGFNMIQGQMAYEERKKLEYRTSAGGRGREIRESLQMMEKIQKIARTKPLGEHATMEDWDDTSTAHQEAVAMMRHFGMMSLGHEISFPQITEDGSERFPLKTDPGFFIPRRTRRPENPLPADCIPEDSADDSYHTAESSSSCIWLYGSGMSQMGSGLEKSNEDRKREKRQTFVLEPKIIPCNMEKSKGKKRNQRPSQKE
ncbi:uncharacterized protein LOC128261572 [Drosophila gunungcola]|uniref:Uncharacterized protein n=1 Tax=Drosophila gunungcola TaxID=103775 RepID=A0A9P9YV42_9MUSC|nr:uncharacterized protein LOC128261572 [Drosophila gunungcola]KAI8043668.1 hypothetical protein M5D96_005001 [Drosophila gunungcola]